ncbi:hypothetical protein GWC95_06660 [Sediminibacterium roseum]|uniref:Beta-lactamase-inhibitor-like, PepSY-like n=1 Tax=Sediminibacterium roseum TaxID=1978412 RepID=A0ABW9ZX39_9BACT|nr:hypothetical protein [Sediminibacterium roseum]NCI49595.1 hypothetical protein [Sediminibacterium roseum]
MKKFFIAALAALAIGTTAFAGPSTVKTKVQNHFASSFSKAQDVTWTSNGKFQQVSFVLNKEKVTAYYDVYGDLVGTTKNLAFDKLPKSAIEYITSTYTFPDYQLKECIEFVNADNDKKYFASFETEEGTVVLEINENGRVEVFQGSVL